MLILSCVYWPAQLDNIPAAAYCGLFYVSVFSMLIGFFFWYKGLALGGIARIGQIQLIQPFLGLMLSAMLLSERISLSMILVSLAVAGCVAMAKKYA